MISSQTIKITLVFNPLDCYARRDIIVAYATIISLYKSGGQHMMHCDLSIIVRGSEIFLSRCLADFGITATEQIMLMYLYTHDNPNQEEIAKFFMLDKGSVAKTLQKLEKKAMIKRTVNEHDQREKVITLTEKAYSVRNVSMNLLKLWNEAIYQDISPEDIAAFERISGKISANVVTDLEKWENLYGKQKG